MVRMSYCIWRIDSYYFLISCFSIPIALQNVNGACPLLALANINFLRGSISLPQGTNEVSKEELVKLLSES